MDEITQFKLWASKLGCPLDKIPADETLKKYIRGKQSVVFRHIMDQVRPRQEIVHMRNNVLVAKLQQFQELGGVLAKSKLNQMPEELQRFQKVRKLDAKIAETKQRIHNSKNVLESVTGKIREKNPATISEADRKQNELEKNGTLSDHDMLQVNIAKLCGSHINQFVDLVAMKKSVQAMKDDYLAKYTPFAQMLETKMNLLNVMDDESDDVLEDYMLQSTSKDFNQGQLDFMLKEIERKKQEIKIQTQRLDNHEQLLAQLREIYSEIDSYSERMQDDIQQLNQIKEKISYFKRFSRYTVHNMRQKTNPNQTMNLSEQSMNMTRIENSTTTTNGPVYSPAALPPYANELTLLAQTPFLKFNKSSKMPIFSLETHICLSSSSAEPNSILSLLPGCFSSAEQSLREARNLQKFDDHIKSFASDTKPELDTASVDGDLYRRLWAANHERICEQLDEIDAISGNTRQIIEKSRVYYDFVLANPLRKYVPPKKLFNGRNYREYESEYLMYYRMINGTMGGK
ncbi:conserved hypothetical protein [Culex quinquefasciatus]|uniref:Uncharacterized protein n=1 Tax=Culex quinquefasciatus TaxID=7176 RepID=B0VZ71_CULQU|nr:conserved hypothetical protein [Culex quinquefasciatus]|eukprot:XP_001841685.1 conserved hypothetical protein [Culex quinquefasciatus]